MREIGHKAIFHFKINGHGRSAQFRMLGRGCVRICHAANVGNIGCELQDTLVVDIVEHDHHLDRAANRICPQTAR